jgi:hypothetical protein
MRFNHIGIPTTVTMPGMTYLPTLKFACTDHLSNPFGIQWMKYDDDCPLPDLVKKLPHVAFEVEDLDAALSGRKVIIAPNSPSAGVTVAFVEEAGAPVELMYYDKMTMSRPTGVAR